MRQDTTTHSEYNTWFEEFMAATVPERDMLNKKADQLFGYICQNCANRKVFCKCKKPDFNRQADLFE